MAKKLKMPGASTYKEWLPTVGDKTRFVVIGKGKKVHVVNTKAIDLRPDNKGGQRCMVVRKAWTGGKIKPPSKDKGLSVEGASALDPCLACRTEVILNRLQPKRSKEQRAAKRDEVLERTKAEHKKSKPERKDKAVTSKPARKSEPTKTKAGTRSVGDSSQAKAEDLVAFMKDNGWPATITSSAPNQATVTAKKGGAVVECNFIDGKYDIAHQASITVGSWSGMLRGAHAVRRQVDSSLDDRDRPHPKPGVGRSAPRKRQEEEPVEDESPEDARKRVPFLLDDDDAVVLDAVMGKVIRWRNGVSNTVAEATVPDRIGKGKRPWVAITVHPKSQRRILNFFEVEEMGSDGPVFGPERSVALEKILRVIDR